MAKQIVLISKVTSLNREKKYEVRTSNKVSLIPGLRGVPLYLIKTLYMLKLHYIHK